MHVSVGKTMVYIYEVLIATKPIDPEAVVKTMDARYINGGPSHSRAQH